MAKAIDAQTILITGATDGLGQRVARDLAGKGARVLLHGRNRDKGEDVLAAMRRETGNDALAFLCADLSSLEETAGLAEAVKADYQRLDVLINNAGVGPRAPDAPRRESRDGHELFFAVNYLAPFLLTHQLLPLLEDSAPARVVNVASVGQAPIDFDDVMLERGYDDFRAYRQSKLAQILFTLELARRQEGSGVTANCLHPATLMDTKMVFDSDYFPNTMSRVGEGAAAVERLAVAPDLEDVSGAYFDGQEPAKADAQAYDPEARRRLWDLSMELTGLAD